MPTSDRDMDAASDVRSVVLYGGPLHKQHAQVEEPLPMDLFIEGSKYIFWWSTMEATDGEVRGQTIYAYSGRADASPPAEQEQRLTENIYWPFIPATFIGAALWWWALRRYR